jgi:AcrR family transcriptional regulator
VEENQRERMLDAVADVASFKGYAAMSVEDIVATAGVSRRTFYDHFKDKEDAFLAAYDAIGAKAIARVQVAYDSSKTFMDGVAACLQTFLEFASSEPQYAEMCIVEVLAAGPRAVERRDVVMRAFARLLHQGAQTMADSIHPPELTAETVIGGLFEILHSRVMRGEATQLLELLPDLAYSMMVSYLGHEAAEREAARLRVG